MVSGCASPPFPPGSSGHSTFATAGPSPKVVTCGGWDLEGFFASCLVLDLENRRWDENKVGPMSQIRLRHAAVSFENIGTYLIGGDLDSNRRTTDFLAHGTTEWTAGPDIPVDMDRPCAVKVSDLNFLAINGKNILEYEVDIVNPKRNTGWQSRAKWPQLQKSRGQRPGCSKVENYIVIAGGYSSGQYLRSTEVLDLTTKTIVSAGDLNSPRAFFHMATITKNRQQRILAFGGTDGSSDLNSVEEFILSNNTWTLSPTAMEETRYSFGAVTLPKELICPTIGFQNIVKSSRIHPNFGLSVCLCASVTSYIFNCMTF